MIELNKEAIKIIYTDILRGCKVEITECEVIIHPLYADNAVWLYSGSGSTWSWVRKI